MTLRTAALCAGYGGLEMGLTIAGVDHDLAWYSELDDAPACDLLNIRTGAPNLGDLTTIHNPPEVDIVTAGFPCQPFSQAGLRKGVEDERFLIDDVCRVAANARARWLILENVAGILSANDGRALSRVCEALARSGFVRWEWGTLRASDVGACHQRKRWFLRALRGDTRSEIFEHMRILWLDSRPQAGPLLPTPRSSDANGPGAHGSGGLDLRTLIHNLAEQQTEHIWDWKQFLPAIERHEVLVGRPAPAPAVDSRLNPVFVEWMMGLPQGHVTDLDLSRAKKLHILGNGVVPQQAAAAITALS